MTPDSSPYPEPPPRAVDAETEARLWVVQRHQVEAFADGCDLLARRALGLCR